MIEQMGDRIKRLRNARNITQKFLADVLEVSTSTVGMYEQNRREPDANTLIKIASFFGVSTDYILCKSNKNSVTPSYDSIPIGKERVIIRGRNGEVDYADFTPEQVKLIRSMIEAQKKDNK